MMFSSMLLISLQLDRPQNKEKHPKAAPANTKVQTRKIKTSTKRKIFSLPIVNKYRRHLILILVGIALILKHNVGLYLGF
jgi:hypothetical protein